MEKDKEVIEIQIVDSILDYLKYFKLLNERFCLDNRLELVQLVESHLTQSEGEDDS